MKVQSKKILFQKTIPAFVRQFSEQFPMLETHFADIETQQLNHNQISNETYGKDSMVYIRFENMDIRRAFESFIKNSREFSFKVFTNYSPQKSITEIQVSYFKGNKWNE